MFRQLILSIVIVGVFWFSGEAHSGELPAHSSRTTQWMIDQEKAWAEQSCGKPWVLSKLLADDFQGTSPKGNRYGKPTGTPVYDPATFHTDCRLLTSDVRFFGSDVAIVYGSESRVVALPESKHERRCLAWTDMWLKRKGKWQIIAAHDTRVDCPPS